MEDEKNNQKNMEGPMEFSLDEMKMPKDMTMDKKTSPKGSPVFLIILFIIAILLITAGGYYVWSTMPNKQAEEVDQNSQVQTTTSDEESLSESDEIDAATEDLENTNFVEIDAKLDNSETENDTELETQ